MCKDSTLTCHLVTNSKLAHGHVAAHLSRDQGVTYNTMAGETLLITQGMCNSLQGCSTVHV